MEKDALDFSLAKVLVVGDTILDRYIWGDVRRISPEAPVPVLKVRKTTQTLGGAGNVANNLIHLGCPTTLVGICGIDSAADTLRDLLHSKKIKEAMIADASRPTIAKTRIMAQKQQMIRLDEEVTDQPLQETLDAVIENVKREVVDAKVVIISDYGKGLFADGAMVQKIIELAKRDGKPVLIDPKGTDWDRYRGATCVTPNTAELEAVVGNKLEDNEPELIQSAEEIRRRYHLDLLLVTRGAQGMALFQGGAAPVIIGSQAREVFDVSGAGDTVIATLAACLAAGCDFETACRTANAAAGIVVGKLGTQPILFSELAQAVKSNRLQRRYPHSSEKVVDLDEMLVRIVQWKAEGDTVVFTNGCFDLLHPGHVNLLYQSRSHGDRLIVGLNSDASVKRLKGPSRPILSEHDRAAILGALECVDAVITFDEDTPLTLIKAIRPDILVKGADYALDQVVGRAEVEAYGGKVQLVPLVPGHSTSSLADRIKQKPA